MGHSWISITGWLTLAITCFFAWTKGAKPEKIAAALILALSLASDLVIATSYPHPSELILFSIDFLFAGSLLVLALRYSSLWLGAAMTLQSLALLAHGVRFSYEGVDTYTWMVFNNVIAEAMKGCLVGATILSWRARRKPKAPAFHFVADPA